MKNITLQKQILDRIRAEHVQPTSRSFFIVRDYAVWALLGFLFAALSIGSGMIMFMLRGVDRTVLAKLGLTFSEKLVYSIPLFWIIATLIIGGAAYLNFQRTRKGYRVTGKQFGIMAAVVAVAFGSIVYAFDIAKYVDTVATSNIPLYSALEPLNMNAWFDPTHGLLSGSVKIKTSDDNFTLRDQNFDLWTISGDNVAMMPADFKFQSGDHVKIIGKKIGDFKFQAIEIRPFEVKIEKVPQSSN